MSTTYAVTIKYIKQGELGTEEQLRETYLGLVAKHNGILGPLTFEEDSLGRLHLHGQFNARKGIKYSLFKVPYMHIYIKPLPTAEDQANWIDYIHKTERAELNKYLNAIKTEYLFV